RHRPKPPRDRAPEVPPGTAATGLKQPDEVLGRHTWMFFFSIALVEDGPVHPIQGDLPGESEPLREPRVGPLPLVDDTPRDVRDVRGHRDARIARTPSETCVAGGASENGETPRQRGPFDLNDPARL